MNRYLIRLLVALLALSVPRLGMAAATLLPNAEQCFSASVGVSGIITGTQILTPGTGATVLATYSPVALTGGSGTGASASITVSTLPGVGFINILNPGTQYVVGDVLSAAPGDIGGITGFTVQVTATAVNASLAGGSVAFYIPNTNTFKQTWSNSTQTTLNTNPVQLNQNGCAIIYGTGTYRQVLKDSLGNTVWDQITADVSANNSTFWAGTAGGSPNVITVVDPGFNATDGSIINFIPISTNTGATTLNPSGFGNIPVVKDTTAGPVALIGGEIVAPGGGTPNIVSVIYSASQGDFHLLNTVIASASGANSPLCGATGLVITNNLSTPNSIITLTARQAVLQTTAGLIVNRSNVSVSVNISLGNSVSAAGGMDAEAPGVSAWIDLFMIDNGAAPSGLGSLAAGNALNPNMPSGYSYKCYLGAMRVDGSGNLLRTRQMGTRVEYRPDNSTNNTGFQQVFSAQSPGPTAWVVQSVIGFVPPTAGQYIGIIEGNTSTGFGCVSSVAFPATNPVCTQYPSASPPLTLLFSTGPSTAATFTFILGTPSNQQFYYATGGSGVMSAFALGWVDAVNAN